MLGIVKVCAIIRSEDNRVRTACVFGLVSNGVRDSSLNHCALQSAGRFQVPLKDMATIPT